MIGFLSRVAGERTFQKRKHLAQLASNERYIEDCAERIELIRETSGCRQTRLFLEPALPLKRTLFFVSAHWGNYFRSFNRIAHSLPEDSRFVAFRGEAWEGEDQLFGSLQRISPRSISVFRIQERRGLFDVCKAIEKGAHAFVLFDVTDRSDRTHRCNFLGSEIGFASGWAELAHITNSIVVLFEPCSVARREVTFASILDPTGIPRDRFVSSCMRAAVRMLERLVAEEPSYWFMWDDWKKSVAHE
ncbi:hypothetical protein [Mesorhizobium sp.]|uniref:hypothetical protein n=1 Tax=Mesorhizobium sp. TaxID=1871066 RepID=UPI000FE3F367|nr:hypothetical protein [Mesorhizobium sp.]RWA76043.1 MAG: hypothetical protein EOQ28_07615 [Mesorhizobium sp.]RWC04125.1 MAG: hypothetical protein EOQ57_07035 [Mesorhizobium sp.]RWG78150.1 MAG: hypothetical protein EOQ69_26980 [Mesorhizobium sp.]RWG90820.1 MAG: hypothetical protein EOQ70_03760 [Mesorhizobium sp.]RWK06633.1 MAG: hypothetical protein EOR39_24415 [Mesorhizobium sp.]